MSSSADRNLLFGVLALQMDFISREHLVSGMQAWILEKEKPLAEHLANAGALRAEHRQLLEPLVEAHIRQHENDPEKSLAAISSAHSLSTALQFVNDDQLHASLSHLARGSQENSLPETLPVPSRAGQRTRFRILRPHAQGGLGRVLVAEDSELHRHVALKELRPEFVNDPDRRIRFTLEAEITGSLEHPGIVPVYSLGSNPDGSPFYAMRFVNGQSLKEAINKYHRSVNDGTYTPTERNIELRRLLQRLIDVCEAINYAHSRGVLHRDLKPGNIMLGRYGETLVVDWGLAKVTGKPSGSLSPDPYYCGSQTDSVLPESPLMPSLHPCSEPTQYGAALGTPAYMSPEQAAGSVDLLGPATDVFALGATLYEILTGQPPYGGNEMLRQAQNANYVRPRKISKRIPKSLEHICLKAMSPDPSRRYTTTGELALDLDRWLADEPITASRQTLMEVLRRQQLRYPVRFLFWLLAGCAAVYFLNAYVSWLFNIEPFTEWQENRRIMPYVWEYLYAVTAMCAITTIVSMVIWSLFFVLRRVTRQVLNGSDDIWQPHVNLIASGSSVIVVLVLSVNLWSVGRDPYAILLTSVLVGLPTVMWSLFLMRRTSAVNSAWAVCLVIALSGLVESVSWYKEYPGKYELISRRVRLGNLPRVKGLWPTLGGHDYWNKGIKYANISRYELSSRLYVEAGEGWRKVGSYSKALEQYEKALSIYPKCADAYDGIAWLRATCVDKEFRDGQRAVEAAKKAYELAARPGDAAKYLYTLAAAHAEAGDFTSAVEVQSRAIKTDYPYSAGLSVLGKGKSPPRLALYQSGKAFRDDGTLDRRLLPRQW